MTVKAMECKKAKARKRPGRERQAHSPAQERPFSLRAYEEERSKA